VENSFFKPHLTLNCRGRLLDLQTPRIMGILNVTPDSFYDGGKYSTKATIGKRAEALLRAGADVLDIGAQSSRPGAEIIAEKEEWQRLQPALEAITQRWPEAVLSVDTFRAAIARKAIAAGAHLINDISAGRLDAAMPATIAELQVPYIIMHLKGEPPTMQQAPHYEDVVSEVIHYFTEKTVRLRQLGVKDLIIDPGFGFGKTLEHNYQLLHGLDRLKIFRLPILVGISRKSMICKVLKINPSQALNGTTALHVLALLKGARLLRAHDAQEAKEVVELIRFYREVNADSRPTAECC